MWLLSLIAEWCCKPLWRLRVGHFRGNVISSNTYMKGWNTTQVIGFLTVSHDQKDGPNSIASRYFGGMRSGIVNIHLYFTARCVFIHNMKMIIIALAFIAVFYLSGVISNGNSAAQLGAVISGGLVIVWYALRAVCCACSQGDKSGCGKRQTKRYVINDRPG